VKLACIASLLQQAMGLDEASIGAETIRNAIRRRMRHAAVTDEADFLQLLQASALEMTALIEEVVVPETWFFRQEKAFQLMQQHLAGAWRRKHPGRTPRLLSIPCSTGEEAYSMAMSLLDAGFPAETFQIDAVDISQQNLHKARRAVYGKGSFRGDFHAFRQRYFREVEAGYSPLATVQHAVKFHQGNILEHSQMHKFGTYDIIFCRNLLIYFNQADRRKTATLLSAMLKDDGLLFVGHAETGPLWKELFDAMPHSMAFSYRPCRGERVASRSARPERASRSPQAIRPKPAAIAPRPAALKKTAPPALTTPRPASTTPAVEESPSLAQITRLADQGNLQAAKQQCEALLRQQGDSAQGWYLLGLISDTQGGKEQARTCLRKALYLEPDHYDALVHLALLLDELGEQAAAGRLRARIERARHAQTLRVAGS